MYRCPNCSAGMRYDIKSQKMLCDYCGYSCAISEHPKQQEDAKKEEYEVTVFTCPQCGGEIRSTDNAAAEFCSYCGASVMLEGRLMNEKKPALIVPFSRTKDDCKDSYKKRANRAWCLPREYKDPDKLEKFTGIYMPYWIYEVNQDASPRLEATRSSGNYTEYMNLDLSVQHTYDWITFDAASDFDDDLSNVINNFEANDSTAFSTAYLSGFYADSPDVDEETYMSDAAQESCEMTMKGIQNKYKDMSIDRPDDLVETFHARVTGSKAALFPVWFLTWRNKDRVSYAVVNGCTGETAADLPVSIPKFIIYSLVMAVPLAILINFLPSIAPYATLGFFTAAGIWSMAQNYMITRSFINREDHITDKGYIAARRRREREAGIMSPDPEEAPKGGFVQTLKEYRSFITLILLVIGYFMLDYIFDEAFMEVLFGFVLSYLIPIAAVVMAVATMAMTITSAGKNKKFGRILADTLILSAASVAAAAVMFLRPPQDIFYYAAAILIFAGIIYGYLGIIHRYNLSCTRPIPEYHERGKRS